jgi:predicted ATP-dependent serine protease
MTIERISTGISTLDTLIEGGIPRAFTVLVAGNPGTGKTILTTHFLYDGLLKGEAALYVSFSESKNQFYENFEGSDGIGKCQSGSGHSIKLQGGPHPTVSKILQKKF